MEWIKVTDDLPKEGDIYWCYVVEINDLGKSGFQWNCYYDPIDKEFRDNHQKMNVTHWRYLMPNPKEPKLVWLRSTKQIPDVWIASSDEEHERGQHLERFNWKQVEK